MCVRGDVWDVCDVCVGCGRDEWESGMGVWIGMGGRREGGRLCTFFAFYLPGRQGVGGGGGGRGRKEGGEMKPGGGCVGIGIGIGIGAAERVNGGRELERRT